MTRYDLDKDDQVDEATALEMERRERYWTWTELFHAICAWIADGFSRRWNSSYVFYMLVLIAGVCIGTFVYRYGSYRITHPPQRELPTVEQLLKLDHEK